jgi:hypothetical protein
MKRRRPEIMKPGLKLLTPLEKIKVSETHKADLERWKALFHCERNKWRLIK